MKVVGVLQIPPIASLSTPNQSPAAVILSHLLDLYPTQVKQPFHLDHRVFVSTSSLLPHVENRRTFTHIFSSSHVPSTTYVGTTSSVTVSSADGDLSKSDDRLTIITIPSGPSLEQFTSLIIQKLQPQWAPRQFLVVDNGASIKLPIGDDAQWTISLGDLRVAQARISGSAAGQSRGMIVELQYECEHDVFMVDLTRDAEREKYHNLFRSFLKGLLKNAKLDLKLDEASINLVKAPTTETAKDLGDENRKTDAQKQNGVLQEQDHKPKGCEIAELYMAILRGARG